MGRALEKVTDTQLSWLDEGKAAQRQRFFFVPVSSQVPERRARLLLASHLLLSLHQHVQLLGEGSQKELLEVAHIPAGNVHLWCRSPSFPLPLTAHRYVAPTREENTSPLAAKACSLKTWRLGHMTHRSPALCSETAGKVSFWKLSLEPRVAFFGGKRWL